MTALDLLADLAPDVAVTLWLRGTAIIAAALLLALASSRASAAMRHGIWAVAFAALAVAPFARPLVPHWTVEVPVPGVAVPHPAFHAATAQQAESSGAGRPAESASPIAPGAGGEARGSVVRDGVAQRVSRTATAVAVLIWLIVATLLVGRLILHGVCAAALVRRGSRVTAGPVQRALVALARPDAHVVLGAGTGVPLASGLLQRVVVLPVCAQAWPSDVLQSVLAHELAHVDRRDYAVHLLVRAAAALYWPNPLVTLAARRLECERERACDDIALRRCAPAKYATHLVEVARLVRRAPAGAAPGMARDGRLFERVRGIISTGIDRRPLSRRRAALAAAILATLAAPALALQLTRPAAPDPFLFDALGDTDPVLRRRAAWALGEFESRRAVPPLLERTRDPEPGVRGTAAWALGEIKDRRAAARLAEMLVSDDDVLVREMAALALGEIGTRAAVEPLAEAARSQPAVRAAAVWALGEIDHESAATQRRRLRFLSPGSPAWPESAAASGPRVPASLDAAIAELSADDPAVRARAAAAAGRIGSLQAVDHLLRALRDPSPAVRAMTVWALDEINPTRSTR